ncbi:MAG: aldehyde dehydrogenase family protein [Planctomycetota bacterium]
MSSSVTKSWESGLRPRGVGAAEHGEVVFEGKAPGGGKRGPFVPPRVVTGLPPEGRFADEGFAGPTLSVFRVNDFEAAAALAGRCPDGASSAVAYWGKRPEAGADLRSATTASHVVVNGPLTGPASPLISADPRTLLPHMVDVVTVRADAAGRGY